MDLCNGSLHDLIVQEKGACDDNQDWKLNIIVKLGQVLHQLHSIPVIHQDIKPENFLLMGNIVKLTDFGLSDFGNISAWTIFLSSKAELQIPLGLVQKAKYIFSSLLWMSTAALEWML